MSDKTAIEWTDATWNPTTGCTQVSPGCDHCYALTLSERFRGTPGHYFEKGFDVQLRPDKLDQPLKWKKPRRIFVNSMSDLFHDDIPDDYIAQVFGVMAMAEQHTFQLLTKRHARMRSLLSNPDFREQVAQEIAGWDVAGRWVPDSIVSAQPDWYPLRNVWIGVSVENQQWATIRIPELLMTPAAVRFLSMEPLIGGVDLTRIAWKKGGGTHLDVVNGVHGVPGVWHAPAKHVDWVIVGGESGRGARPMKADWARVLRDQVTNASIAFHFKQWGAHGPDGVRRSKHDTGRELDGRTWDEFPEVAS
jgi:protein gp37